ncbi:hypothetical protein Patl1_17401 [Pistacia atlantica]|uniref:Uncharacterized protein n=1 Tax=Pistacia atlantica TaxID=434234 RepID=A0ACC1BXM3_9ROSI|nr:hypothetical protein Patl1_17401 [Pistacia atlantica]
MGTRSEFVGRKKGVVRECGSGLRMQEKQSDGSKRLMVFDDDDKLLSSSSAASCCESSITSGGFVGGGGSGSGSGGPLFCNTSNQVACMSDIYDVVGVASASGSATNTATALFPAQISKLF